MQIRQILKEAEVGSTLSISAWVSTRRKQKTFSFVEINDGSCLTGLQVIIDDTVDNYEQNIALAGTGASVKIEGTVVASQGNKQRIELHATAFEIIGEVAEDYPLQKKRQSPEFLRDIAHLRARTKVMGMSTRVRSACAQAVHEFFKENGFYYIHTPIITASDFEGA